MQKAASILLLAYFVAFTLPVTAQTDTIALLWEALPQPPVSINAYAQQGNRLFAATDFGLFYSDDFGQNWQQHPEFRIKVENVVANGGNGVIVEQFVQSNAPYLFFLTARYYIYYSSDGGQTFGPPIREVDANIIHHGQTSSTRVQMLNDSTFFYVTQISTLSSISTLVHFSYDGGVTWEESDNIPPYCVLGLVHLSTDTMTQMCDLLTITRRSASDLAQVVIDSVQLPIDSLSTYMFSPHVIFRNNRYYVYNGNNQLLVSNDFGGTWAIETLLLPQGRRQYYFHDDYVYARMAQGVFRAHLNAPTAFSHWFVSPTGASPGGGPQFFDPRGDVMLLSEQGNTFVSTDQGATWSAPMAGPFGSSNEVRSRQMRNAQANGRFWLQSGAGMWRSDESGHDWVRMSTPDFYATSSSLVTIINSPDSLLLGVKGEQSGPIVYSPDGGETWLPTINSPNHMLRNSLHLSGGRVFVITRSSQLQVSWLVNGNTWVNKNLPGPPGPLNSPVQLFASGTTIAVFGVLANGGFARSLSMNNGDTWQRDTLTGFSPGQLIDYGGRLLNMTEAGFFESLDFGQTWAAIAPGQELLSYYTTPLGPVPPRMVAQHDGVLFVTTDKGLRYTTDLGVSWTVVDEVPFFAKVTELPSGTLWSDEIPASATYVIRDGHLYALSQGHGIFRTSLEPIIGQPTASVTPSQPRTATADIGVRVFPNPASDMARMEIDVPQAAHLRIEVLDLLGQRVITISDHALFPQGKHLRHFDTTAWPSGLYLIRFQVNGKSFVQKFSKQ